MSGKLLIGIAVLAGGCVLGAKLVFARAGDLDRPSISIPVFEGKSDPVAKRMSEVLATHRKEFIGGHYINAHSTLDFAGGTKTINALLAGLSKVEGATIYVHFSKDEGVSHRLFGKAPGDRPCACSLDHNGWANAQAIGITIYVSNPDLDICQLTMPAIQGR
jgi:hypothetical protein